MTTMKVALRTGVLLEMAWSDAALAPGERGQRVNTTALWAREPGGRWQRLRGSRREAEAWAGAADSLDELVEVLGG